MTQPGNSWNRSVPRGCVASHRRGAILAAAMVAFLMGAVIVFGILQAVVNHYRQIRVQRLQMQAELLAQAGIDRALAQLRQSAAYRGETWKPLADDAEDFGPAEVLIQIEAVTDRPDDVRVVAQADYPADTPYRARKTRDAIVHLK